MASLPQNVYSVKQTRALDKRVIEHHGTSAATLIKRAGVAALELVRTTWPSAQHLLIACGTGNNAGDGFELALQAIQSGYKTTIIQIAPDSALTHMSAETATARAAYLATGAHIITSTDGLSEYDLIVDGIFGTGLNRDITGQYRALIDTLNAQSCPVLALDIPSGLNADTGQIMGCAIKATLTLSFIGLNTGLFTGEGPNYCGQIAFSNLGVPDEIYQLPPTLQCLSIEQQSSLLIPRARTGHKGNYGHALVIGGNTGLSGAVRMAAEASARVGAGLVSVATHPDHASLINLTRPELMSHAISQSQQLPPLLSKASVVAIGPGLGQDEWGKQLFDRVLHSSLPMVIDADGLNLLSQSPQYRDNWILTPHPGEAARLLNCTTRDIQADRIQAVKAIQKQYGGIAVLKGAGTLICDGHSAPQLSRHGNPGMGSGGMGDVLTGIILGLLAQKCSLMEAACLGVTLHGLAGDKAAQLDGERGLQAMDLMPHLRHLVNLLNID